MEGITNWVGTVWGTNRGTILVQFEHKANTISGGITLVEPGLGTSRARVRGTWGENNVILATLDQFTTENQFVTELPKSGQFEGTFNPTESAIHGQWKTDRGTNGQFIAVAGAGDQPALAPQASSRFFDAPIRSQVPLGPLVTTTLNVGAVRLDSEELASLAKLADEGTNIQSPVINAIHNAREYRHLGMESLLSEPALPGFVESVIVAVDEKAAGNGDRQVVVRLMMNGPNTIFVAGYDRIWVEGKARQIEVFLQGCESKIISFWRKYGNNANAIVFLALIGILPSIPSLLKRFAVVAVVFLFLTILRLTWTKVVNTRVILKKTLVPFHIRYADWLVTPLAALFTAIVAYLIQRFVPGAK